jgi:uncharacterized SAM-binding protein YcdF (DUF218 family)
MLTRIDTIAIPNFPQPPALSDAVIDEITEIVFGANEFGTAETAQPCDLIFIFGGSHPGLWIAGAQAYHAGLGPHLIATGGYKPTAIRHHTWQHGTRAEALVIRDELMALGVPEQAITVEDRSTNSLENVLFAQQCYDFSTVTSILVVTRNHGAGRQCRTLRRHIDPRIRVCAYPFATNVGRKGEAITRENWATMDDSRAGIFSNLLKIIKYGRKGDIEPLTHISDELLAVVNEWLETAPIYTPIDTPNDA